MKFLLGGNVRGEIVIDKFLGEISRAVGIDEVVVFEGWKGRGEEFVFSLLHDGNGVSGFGEFDFIY